MTSPSIFVSAISNNQNDVPALFTLSCCSACEAVVPSLRVLRAFLHVQRAFLFKAPNAFDWLQWLTGNADVSMALTRFSTGRLGWSSTRNIDTLPDRECDVRFVCLFVGCLLNVQATCECISGTDLLRQECVLPHWDRSCRPNFPPHPVTVYWHRASQSQHWPFTARRLTV